MGVVQWAVSWKSHSESGVKKLLADCVSAIENNSATNKRPGSFVQNEADASVTATLTHSLSSILRLRKALVAQNVAQYR